VTHSTNCLTYPTSCRLRAASAVVSPDPDAVLPAAGVQGGPASAVELVALPKQAAEAYSVAAVAGLVPVAYPAAVAVGAVLLVLAAAFVDLAVAVAAIVREVAE
jgi:hypothetical protein